MIQSDTISSLLAELVKIQAELPTMPQNAQAYGYKYADLDTITGIIKPILAKHEVAYMQTLTTINNNPALTTRIFNSKGEYIEDSTILPTITNTKNNPAQTMGMSITYVRRYALCSILGITSDEDTDANETKQPQKTTPQNMGMKKASEMMKGGEATPQEKAEINSLLASKYENGAPVFTQDEKIAYSAMRKDKTAQELIDFIKNALQNRIDPRV